MKKLLVTMAVAITGVVQAFALSPSAIRENARFLTDRMAYELNLTPIQYEDCYEINYDFIYAVNPIMDEVVYGYPEYIDMYYNYLDYRNEDLRYIMNEAQYLAFMSLDYFFRPIYTYAGNWLFRVFQIYTNTRYFYYDPPRIYHSYIGGHARRHYPHGFYGGGRYSHHVYARPHPIDRMGGRHDFAPYSGHRRGHGYSRGGYYGNRGGYDNRHHRNNGNDHHGNNGNRGNGNYGNNHHDNNHHGGGNGGNGNYSNGNRGNNNHGSGNSGNGNYGNGNRGNNNHGSGNSGNGNYGNGNRGNNNHGSGNSGNGNRGNDNHGHNSGSGMNHGSHSHSGSGMGSGSHQSSQIRQHSGSSSSTTRSSSSSRSGGGSHSGVNHRGHGGGDSRQSGRR